MKQIFWEENYMHKSNCEGRNCSQAKATRGLTKYQVDNVLEIKNTNKSLLTQCMLHNVPSSTRVLWDPSRDCTTFFI